MVLLSQQHANTGSDFILKKADENGVHGIAFVVVSNPCEHRPPLPWDMLNKIKPNDVGITSPKLRDEDDKSNVISRLLLMCFRKKTALREEAENKDECAKNPGHPDFIPFQTFTVKHLPLQFQDNDVFELIKTIGDLTVRVSVTHVSVRRPDVFPETITPFPLSDKKGSNELRTATGWVDKVKRFYEFSEKFCTCEQCLVSENPSKVWGELHVVTAAHVVFDDNEAKHSSFRWGFNENESPAVTFKGGQVRDIDPLADRCTVVCATCDLGLIDKATSTLAQRDILHKKIQEKDRGLDEKDNLVVVVSHPHGFPKQVTVGYWTERNLGANNETRYVYTASTCPGSGGAPVYILSRIGLPSYHCHSGYSPNKGNFSCVWLG